MIRRVVVPGAVVTLLALSCPAAHAAAGPNMTRLVSVTSQGSSGNGPSSSPAVSPGGRFVAFTSTATDLVPGTARRGALSRVYLRDTVLKRTTLVSVSTAGGDPNSYSNGPSVSDDGRYVAFSSAASNLVAGDRNRHDDVFLRDVTRHRTILVSRGPGGRPGNASSEAARISGNGAAIAFESWASNLVRGDGNGSVDVFVAHRVTGVIQRVSESRIHGDGTGESTDPAIDSSGRYVAFLSTAHNLVAGYRRTGRGDIFRRDMSRDVTVQVSPEVTSGPRGVVADPVISGDGHTVAFLFYGLTGPSNPRFSIGLVSLPSGAFTAFEPASIVSAPSVDAHGQRVAFFACARNCGTPRRDHIYVYDRSSETTVQVDVSRGPVQAANATDPVISNDGRFVAFTSSAGNLARPDGNGTYDVFLRHLTF